jgi:hypothetical protein
MAKDGNLAQAKATEAKAKAKGGKPKGGSPKEARQEARLKANYEEGEEMEGAVDGKELKFDGIHHPKGGPTVVSIHWASCTH